MASVARSFLLAGILGLTTGVASAAEWAAAPVFFLNADHQSNRNLRPDPVASESFGASLDLGIARRTETSELTISPRYYGRRISPDVESDLDELRFPVRLTLRNERSSLAFGAYYADESTLTTELDATGVLLADASRITSATNASWRFAHADSREFNATASFSDVNYTGGYQDSLRDYRYAAFSAGESFVNSPRLTFSLNGFGSQLRSGDLGSESREMGVSLGFFYSWSENTRMSGSLGMSRREFDGNRDNGRTGSFSLTHRGETRDWNLSLDHSLVPFGTGVLTERDAAQLSVTENFDSRWLGIARLGLSRNEDVLRSLGVDTRTYRYADLELRWLAKQTLSIGLVSGYADAQDPGLAERGHGWTVALRTTWAPGQRVFGH